MPATHLVLIVEEPSAEAFFRILLPRLMPDGVTHEIIAFQGKGDLLSKIEGRLRGYAHWLPADWRIAVLIDRDDDNCVALKQTLEQIARDAGLRTRSRAAGGEWQLVNRIAIEELEAWYFGEWRAVLEAFPRVSPHVPSRAAYRDPDAISGGTWEAFARVLQAAGYCPTGLPKIDTARRVAAGYSPSRCSSGSFRAFRDAINEAFPAAAPTEEAT